MLPILEYGASCWDPYREGQINALNCEQKKAAKFANHTNVSVWETLELAYAPCSNHAPENGHGNLEERGKGPCYLGRDDHDCKIRAR